MLNPLIDQKKCHGIYEKTMHGLDNKKTIEAVWPNNTNLDKVRLNHKELLGEL
jgi:hypothetical protein